MKDSFKLNRYMAKLTFSADIKSTISKIETAKTGIAQAKIEGLGLITKKAFGQMGNKYIVKGNYATPSKSGKTLNYTSPPGANISKTKTLFNRKTRFKTVFKVALWVAGKIVSRSGKYQKLVERLSNTFFGKGSTRVDDVKVVIDYNGVKIYADPNSEFYKLETFKQAGRGKVSPLTKSMRSVVNLWKSVRIKLNK